MIPEQHADEKSWHMHGLLMGLPKEHLHEFTKGEKLPIKMLVEIAQGSKLYSWPAYAKKFGYISISEIRHIESVSKYITKDLAQTKIEMNNHLYYSSQSLKRAEIIYQGPLIKDLDEDFSNEYVKIKTVQTLDEATEYMRKSALPLPTGLIFYTAKVSR